MVVRATLARAIITTSNKQLYMVHLSQYYNPLGGVEGYGRYVWIWKGVVWGVSQDQMLNLKLCWTPQILVKKPIEGTQAEEKKSAISSLGSYSRQGHP